MFILFFVIIQYYCYSFPQIVSGLAIGGSPSRLRCPFALPTPLCPPFSFPTVPVSLPLSLPSIYPSFLSFFQYFLYLLALQDVSGISFISPANSTRIINFSKDLWFFLFNNGILREISGYVYVSLPLGYHCF